MDLVVGASGLLGNALCERLRAGGVSFMASSRAGRGGGTPLDLAAEPASWALPRGVSAAYLCAAATALRDCEAEPDRTALVNVERTVELARRLAADGAFVVFPSTNLVFDGAAFPAYAPGDPISPVTEYGRQKARAEAGLLSLPGQVAIVRLSKVLHPGMPLLRGWVEALRRGESVRAFADLRFSPISPEFVAEALHRIADRRLAGITHLSGSGQISYADLARAVARRLGVEESLVISVETPDGPARSAALDAERATRELDLPPPDVAQMVRELIDSLR